MSTYVQVMPLVDEDGEPCWTTVEGAEYFGVYVGHPGAFEWLADVPQRESAMRIAYGIAANEGIPRENVYLVGEEPGHE